MRKLITTFSLLVLCCTYLSAQAHFGARVGVNFDNISVNEGDIDTEGQTNLMLGAFVDLPLGANLVSVQPELNYLNRGFTTVGAGGIDAKTTISYLDLGALLKLNFNQDGPLGFYVGAGPYLRYAMDGKVSVNGNDTDIDFDNDRVKRGGLAFNGIGGVTFGSAMKFFAEVRYNGGLYNLFDDGDTDVRQNSIGINGGVMVPLGN